MSISSSESDLNRATSAWLDAQLRAHGMSGADLARELNARGYTISQAYISKIRNKGMSLRAANRIAELMRWPAFSMLLTTGNHPISSTTTLRTAPIHGAAEQRAAVHHILIDPHYFWDLFGIESEHLLFFRFPSSEMEPTIRFSDVLVINTGQTHIPHDNEDIWALRSNDHIYAARPSRILGGKWRLKFDNPGYPTKEVDEIEVLGKVHAKFFGMMPL